MIGLENQGHHLDRSDSKLKQYYFDHLRYLCLRLSTSMYFEFLSTRTQFNSPLDIISPKVELVWCSSDENIMKQLVWRNDYNNFIYCLFLSLSIFCLAFTLDFFQVQNFFSTPMKKKKTKERTQQENSHAEKWTPTKDALRFVSCSVH